MISAEVPTAPKQYVARGDQKKKKSSFQCQNVLDASTSGSKVVNVLQSSSIPITPIPVVEANSGGQTILTTGTNGGSSYSDRCKRTRWRSITHIMAPIARPKKSGRGDRRWSRGLYSHQQPWKDIDTNADKLDSDRFGNDTAVVASDSSKTLSHSDAKNFPLESSTSYVSPVCFQHPVDDSYAQSNTFGHHNYYTAAVSTDLDGFALGPDESNDTYSCPTTESTTEDKNVGYDDVESGEGGEGETEGGGGGGGGGATPITVFMDQRGICWVWNPWKCLYEPQQWNPPVVVSTAPIPIPISTSVWVPMIHPISTVSSANPELPRNL